MKTVNPVVIIAADDCPVKTSGGKLSPLAGGESSVKGLSGKRPMMITMMSRSVKKQAIAKSQSPVGQEPDFQSRFNRQGLPKNNLHQYRTIGSSVC